MTSFENWFSDYYDMCKKENIFSESFLKGLYEKSFDSLTAAELNDLTFEMVKLTMLLKE